MKVLFIVSDFLNNTIFRYTDLFNIRKRYFNERNKILKTILRNIYYLKGREFGSWISLNTKFSDKPIFPHKYFGIFISGEAQLGENCIIYQQVTIGSDSYNNKSGAPIIGNNVLIGSGAKIIGCIQIGNNVKIGANCIVTEDIPDNITVVMNKPRKF